MFLNAPSMATVVLVAIGAVIAFPVLFKGFVRRGKGVFYEKNFLIQRAPQYATLLTVIVLVLGFLSTNKIVELPLAPLFSQYQMLGQAADLVSWLGVAILISGLIFMIGGWISLGEMFTTDAEVLDGHHVRRDGLLSLVMHPAYSGIIQSVLGASLAGASLFAAFLAVGLVAPLWLNRAKYEEAILLESLGPEYKKYAEDMKWRRLIPRFIPIGV